MRSWIWNTNITLQGDRSIPSIRFPQDSHLFDRKPCWDGSMQVNGDGSNFGQLNMKVRYWIFLKLRKQQRLKLPVLLKPGKAKSSLLKVLPSYVQLLNRELTNLRGNLTQSGEFLLGFGQVVKRICISFGNFNSGERIYSFSMEHLSTKHLRLSHQSFICRSA